jgi:hypothetical protein
MTAAFAALAGTQVLAGFISDARESAKVGRITEQTLRSTGGAAKISAGQVSALANAISNKTGKDDEAIQSGENLLLSFRNVRNETGKGNDIFNQASSAIVDMTAALNNGKVTTEGVKASSIQLGKALNDPIKGVSALQRVGVSFTASQKKQIASLVQHGHTLDAQKIILRELGQEFGGAAKASSDPMERLGTILGNLGERLGTWLLPQVDRFATFVTAKAIPVVTQIAAAFARDWLPKIQAVGSFLTGTAIPAVAAFTGWLNRHRTEVVAVAGAFAALVAITKVHTAFLAVQGAGGLAKYIASTKIVTAVTKAWAAATWALGIAQKFALGPIGLVIIGVAAAAAGLIYAYKHSDRFRAVVQFTWKAVAQAASVAWNSVLKPTFAFLADAFRFTAAAARTAFALIRTYWNVVLRPQLQAIGTVVGWLWTHVFRPILGKIDEAWKFTSAVIRTIWQTGIRPIFSAVGTAIGKTRDAFRSAVDAIGVIWAKLRDKAAAPVRFIVNVVYNRGIRKFYNTIAGRFGGDPLPPGPRFASGGVLPMVVNRPTAIVGEGNTTHPEYVIPTDPKYRDRARGLWQQAGAQLMAEGGVLGWAKGPLSKLRSIENSPYGKLLAGMTRSLVSGLGKKLASFSLPSGFAAAPKNVAGVVLLGQRLAAQLYGWIGAQWNALFQLWNNESGWNPNAQNPTSTAYGIAQFLNSTWATVGATKTSDPGGQIVAGLRYIRQAYGSPGNAWAKWQSRSPHWYDQGGPILEPIMGVGRSGRTYGFQAGEKVVPAHSADQPTRLHPADIRALADAIAGGVGGVVVRGLGAYNVSSGQRAELLMRGG